MAEQDYLTTRDFLSARNFFEAVRDAVLEGERVHRQISSMKAGEGIRSASLFGGHGAARDVTGMARVDARKQEANMASRRQLAAAAAMIEATCDVVEIGAPGGIETVLALAALDEAAMWVGRMLGPRGES